MVHMVSRFSGCAFNDLIDCIDSTIEVNLHVECLTCVMSTNYLGGILGYILCVSHRVGSGETVCTRVIFVFYFRGASVKSARSRHFIGCI